MRQRNPIITYGISEVAEWLGIGRAAVTNYLARWPNDVPQPDAVIVTPGQEAWGWKAERRAEWQAFYDKHHATKMRDPRRRTYAPPRNT